MKKVETKNECSVCGDCDNVTKKYGPKACASCRKFFRLSVGKSNWKKYACQYCEFCTIDAIRRSWCCYCRYKKMESVGMKKHLVKNLSRVQKLDRQPLAIDDPREGERSSSDEESNYLKMNNFIDGNK